MKYLSKKIERIILFDFFTEAERNQPLSSITNAFADFFKSINMPTTSYFPNTKEEALQNLQTMKEIEDLKAGVILHFIGHSVGDEVNNPTAFGNTNFSIQWNEIKEYLIELNYKTNSGLILNTSIMCYGNSIFRIVDDPLDNIFFACLASTSTMSLQALYHNKEIYRGCIRSDFAEMKIAQQNYYIEQSQDKMPYELRYWPLN